MANRQERIITLIGKNLRDIVQFEVKNSKIGFVTITDIEVSNDSFCIQIDKEDIANKEYIDVKDITKDDVIDGKCEERLTEEDILSTTDTLDIPKFQSFIESNAPTEIYFVITGKDSGEDISTNQSDDEPIYAWMEDNKMYVSAKDADTRIKLSSGERMYFTFAVTFA